MDKLINDDGFNENEKEILKFIISANCAIKAAKQWPEDRKAHLEYCRNDSFQMRCSIETPTDC